MKKLLRTEPGIRLDQPDVQDLAEQSEIATAALAEGCLVGSASYILRGFKVTNTTTAVTITRDEYGGTGAALLAWRDAEGQTTWGHITSGTPTARTYDVSSFADNTWYVYLRLAVTETDYANRAFWNPDSTAGGPVETVQNVASRYATEWQVAMATSSPGTEWLQIASFVVSSGVVVGSATDLRPLYFEGSSAASYAPDTDWGDGANDRSSDRVQYGLRDMRTAVRALQRQVQDIIGSSANWWDAVSLGLAELGTTYLRRDGGNTVTGNILPDGGTRELGSAAARYLRLWASTLHAGAVDMMTGATAALDLQYDSSSDTQPEVHLHDSSTGTVRGTIAYSPGTAEFTLAGGEFAGTGAVRVKGTTATLAGGNTAAVSGTLIDEVFISRARMRSATGGFLDFNVGTEFRIDADTDSLYLGATGAAVEIFSSSGIKLGSQGTGFRSIKFLSGSPAISFSGGTGTLAANSSETVTITLSVAQTPGGVVFGMRFTPFGSSADRIIWQNLVVDPGGATISGTAINQSSSVALTKPTAFSGLVLGLATIPVYDPL